MKYYDKFRHIGVCCLMLHVIVGCTEVWDDHYDTGNLKQNADKTLWEEIESRPELANFAELLKTHGYAQMLDGDQMFTVFAPLGDIDTLGLSAKKVKTEVLDNHLARFVHSAISSTIDKDVVMLNTKLVRFTKSGEEYMFGDNKLTDDCNIVAKNGVLHVIEAQQPFFHNIWEYLTTDAQFDSVRTYLYSFNEEYLDENASVKGEIIDGKQEYIDSVVYTSNEMFYRLGQLNVEDSTYSMIVPTNEAWIEAYDRVSSYYTYPRSKSNRDSLQRHYTSLALVSDLVFSHAVQEFPEDYLISTYPAYQAEDRHVFKNPFDGILSGYTGWDDGVECSNGRVFKVDSLRHAPWESWHTRIKVEGESTNALTVKNAANYRREMPHSDSLYTEVSGGNYVEVVASSTSASAQPVMEFNVWGSLAAKYDVKIVFMPQSKATSKSTSEAMKPNMYRVSYTCRTAQGELPESYTDIAYKNLTNDPTKIDTVDVGTISLPFCAYGDDAAGLKIQVKSNINPSQYKKNAYSTTYLIDCIILEPSKN